MKEVLMMNKVMIFGLILMVWAIIGMIGVNFKDSKKTNWCGILFFFSVPFIPFIAKLFGVI